MEFTIGKEQKMFKDSAREFLSKEWTIELLREVIRGEKGYSIDHWKKIADLGWLGMLIDERYGGSGLDFFDICLIEEEIGYALFPSPFLISSIVAASILSEVSNKELKENLLSKIADGNCIVTMAVGETGDVWAKDEIETKLERHDKKCTIVGSKLFVPFANVSDYIIGCAKDDQESSDCISLFLINAKSQGVTCTPIPTFSIDRYSRVGFDKVIIPEENVLSSIGGKWDLVQEALQKLIACECMEIVGGLKKVLEVTVRWAKSRKQFGAPIGSFQAIQHHCAEMAVDVEASKFITYQAAWRLSNKLSCRKEISMAKAWSGDAYQRVTARALQVHGAMGFTEEYDLQFYFKQAKALQLMYGGRTHHRKIVAQETGYM